MTAETDIASLARWGKVLGHETRVEILIKLIEEEDRVERFAMEQYAAKGKPKSKREQEERVFGGLSPSKLSKLVGPGLEKRRRKPAKKKTKEKDPNLSSASYHVRELIETFKVLEFVRTKQCRGAMEHFYRIRPEAKETLRKILALELG
ncbi:MAG TPA: hypothetical protein VIF43_03300 [Patescibacteria group bacterium]|jgi:hypothetical protein